MLPNVETEHNGTRDMHQETKKKKLMGPWGGNQEGDSASSLILRTFVMWAGEEGW